jgi:hypothetical protein
MSRKTSNRNQSDNPKVGSDPEAAKQVGGKGDFGAPESDRIEREYASRADRNQDPGAPPPHSSGDGTRVSGVGANNSGPGSGSGGDLDPDIIGVGTGGAGVAASGMIHEPAGPDTAQPTSQRDPNRIVTRGNTESIKGTTVDRSGGDVSTTGGGQGAASVTNPNDPDNDSNVGEISLDESAGGDNAPSDNK